MTAPSQTPDGQVLAPPTVSAVVVAYNSARHLPGTLRAIRDACSAPLEMVVVDNDSADDTQAAVRASGIPVHLVRAGGNLGFAKAANLGARTASGEFVCFVNPDATPQAGSIDALVAAARRRPAHLLYQGLTLTGDAIDTACALPLPSLWGYLCFATGIESLARGNRWLDPHSLGGWNRDTERVVPAVAGAFVLTAREAFLTVGGFDEAYWMYSEDIDLSARAHRMGMPPLHVPTARAQHLNGGSSTSAWKASAVLRGQVTYMDRNWGPVRRRIGKALLQAGVALRARVDRRSKWADAWTRREEWRAGW